MLVASGLLGLCAAFGFMCQRVAERGRFVRAYSSYGAGAEGARALYLLVERMGARPMRWSEDLARLPEGGAMLVALGSCDAGMARRLSRFEAGELSAWIHRGGVLLVAGTRHYLPDGLGVRFEPEAGCTPTWNIGAGAPRDGEDLPPVPPPISGTAIASDGDSAWALSVATPLAGLDPIPLRGPGRLVIDAGAAHTVLLTLPDAPTMPDSPIERVAGVIVTHGRGRVVVLASGSPFQNRAIATTEGAPMFARLVRAYAPRGPVLFDEYHLGVGERRSFVRYLRQRGATGLAFPIALAALIALWRAGARFGAVRASEPPVVPGTASFVNSLGRLFERAGDPPGAVDLLRRHALVRIARHHHLASGTAHALASALRRRGLVAAATNVERIGQAASSLGRERGALVAVARRIDEWTGSACA
jgi:hypothetical protein